MMFMPMFSPVRKAVDGVTMVAGSGGQWVGYARSGPSYPNIDIGSLSGQPLIGVTVIALATHVIDQSLELDFDGDVYSLVSGVTLYVNGESYPLSGADVLATDNEGRGEYTYAAWENAPFEFIDGHSYNIRIE